MNELKADVEKMGASYEEICKEILEEEFEKEQQVVLKNASSKWSIGCFEVEQGTR